MMKGGVQRDEVIGSAPSQLHAVLCMPRNEHADEVERATPVIHSTYFVFRSLRVEPEGSIKSTEYNLGTSGAQGESKHGRRGGH